jgi:hypothetical protein
LYDEAAIAAHMNRADAFVVAGRVGLAINHALGYGLPVICFRRSATGPCHGSEIDHLKPGITGYFVEDHTAAAMAERLTSLFADGHDFKLRHAAAIEGYVGANLSIARMFEAFRQLRDHIAAGQQLYARSEEEA